MKVAGGGMGSASLPRWADEEVLPLVSDEASEADGGVEGVSLWISASSVSSGAVNSISAGRGATE